MVESVWRNVSVSPLRQDSSFVNNAPNRRLIRCNASLTVSTRSAAPCIVIEAEGMPHCPISRTARNISSCFSLSEAHEASDVSCTAPTTSAVCTEVPSAVVTPARHAIRHSNIAAMPRYQRRCRIDITIDCAKLLQAERKSKFISFFSMHSLTFGFAQQILRFVHPHQITTPVHKKVHNKIT